MTTHAERVAIAEARVAEARRIVERQRKIVEAHRRRLTNAVDAEALLGTFERSLRLFEDELTARRNEKK